MEYRGYDSVGVATKSDHQILTKKGVGKVSEVNNTFHLGDSVIDASVKGSLKILGNQLVE